MFFKKMVEMPPCYWEESSYLMAIAAVDEELLKKAMGNLKKSEDIKLLDNKTSLPRQSIDLKLEYLGDTYEVSMYEGGVNVPFYYLQNLSLSEEEKTEILNAKKCITLYMKFDDNPKKCFHLQLKLAALMIPDLLAVLDESAERIFVRDWVQMTANSKFLPSAKDLFSVQAVTSENGHVWLHTHGLARTGLRELEILDSRKEVSKNHYNLLNTYAMYLIDRKDENENNGDYIGALIDGSPLVVTSIPWVEGLKEYKNLDLGGKKDRKDGHNTVSNVVFVYTSEDNEKNNVLSKVNVIDDLLGENPIFFLSDEETERMKSVAIERFDYVKKILKKGDSTILLKIGLPLEDGQFEHIWFELLEFKGKKFHVKLTQEPYYFPDLHEGDERDYSIDDITDWIIYTDTMAITPDNVYLLEKMK